MPSFRIISSSLFTTFRHFVAIQSELLTSDKLQTQMHVSPPSPLQITYYTLSQAHLPSLASQRPSNGTPFTYSLVQGRNIIYQPGMPAVLSNSTFKMKHQFAQKQRNSCKGPSQLSERLHLLSVEAQFWKTIHSFVICYNFFSNH